MLQGSQVAQKAINDAGGILDRQLNLAHADTQCDEADSVPALRQLMATQNLVGIIGPETQEINADAPILTQAKIPAEFQGGSTLFDHNTKPFLWRDSPSDSQLGVAMALYAHKKGYQSAALLFYSDIAAQTFAAPITATWKKLGHTIVSNVTVAPDQTSYRTQVQQVINAHPDVIFTQTDPATAAVLFQNFKELNNLAIPFVGTDVTGSDEFLRAVTYATANAHLISVYGTSVTGQAADAFNQVFAAQFGSTAQPLANANYAYDAVISLALAILFMARLSGSRFGLALRSLREDERAAAAFGRDIYTLKLKACVLGAACGGLAGSLFAAYLSAFNPSAWSPIETIVLYSAILVGGKGNIRGVVLGVVIMIVLVQESTRFLPEISGHPAIIPALREIVVGAVLVLFLRFHPQGLLPERRYIDRAPSKQLALQVNAPPLPEAAAVDPPSRSRLQDEQESTPEPVVSETIAEPVPEQEQVVAGTVAEVLVSPAPEQDQAVASKSVTEALVVKGLSKHFGGVIAVDNCSFQILQGQVTGLIGPNGAGKSTAIDLIAGFKLPDTGTVLFEGAAIQGLPPHRVSRLGLIRTFQTPREWPALTVLENVLLARWDRERKTFWRSLSGSGRLQHSTPDADFVRARAILKELGLTELTNERAGNLSGGQKRLVEFARIRMASPHLVILDEPMGGVNPVLGERMAEAIQGFVDAGTTVLIVEHNLPFIERVTHHVIVMAEGSVIADGSFESLRSNQSVIDAYLGGGAL